MEGRLRQTHAQKLSLEQRHGLELRLLLALELRHPEIHDVLRGLEGMRTAREVLLAQNTVGILIGGLAEAVCNKKTTSADLDTHKDVDVMVLGKNFSLEKPFEHGIYWWVPNTETVTVTSDVSPKGFQRKVTWWENGNEVFLSFGIEQRHPLAPGLYLMDAESIRALREAETEANIDYGRAGITRDEETIEAFRKVLRKRIPGGTPPFLAQEFEGFRIDLQGDERSPFLVEFDLPLIRAINRFRHVEPEKSALWEEPASNTLRRDITSALFYEADNLAIGKDAIEKQILDFLTHHVPQTQEGGLLSRGALRAIAERVGRYVGNPALEKIRSELKSTRSPEEREQIANRQIQLIVLAIKGAFRHSSSFGEKALLKTLLE